MQIVIRNGVVCGVCSFTTGFAPFRIRPRRLTEDQVIDMAVAIERRRGTAAGTDFLDKYLEESRRGITVH